MSEYVKIRKQILIDIADAIRLQKETTKEYKPNEFAGVIRKFLCLPAAEAIGGSLTIPHIGALADGALPDVQRTTAESSLGTHQWPIFSSNASGLLNE